MWSLRTSQCIAAPHLARITRAVAGGARHGRRLRLRQRRPRASSTRSPPTDKTLEFIKADHYLLEPGGARQQAADLIAAWVGARADG